MKKEHIAVVVIAVFAIAALVVTSRNSRTDSENQNLVDTSKLQNIKPPKDRYQSDLFTDGKHVFFNGNEIPEIDFNSMEIITPGVIKDKSNVFLIKKDAIRKIGLDGAIVRVVNDHTPLIVADNTTVYIDAGYSTLTTLPTISNPAQFEAVYTNFENGSQFYTDKKNFYFLVDNTLLRLPIEGGVLFPYSSYVKGDKVSYGPSLIPLADVPTFKVFGLPPGTPESYEYAAFYAKDKNYVYYKGMILTGADTASFTIYPARFYQEFGHDNSHVYFHEQLIPGANPATFQVLKFQPYEGCTTGEYGKDDKAVYFQTKKVLGANPQTFTIGFNDYAKDGNKTFWREMEITDPTNIDASCDYDGDGGP